MKYHFNKVQALVFILVKFIIINASQEHVTEVCSGQGSKWNTSTSRCDCADGSWGKHCEFNRQSGSCKDETSCKGCLQVAGCGWCEDGSGTGLGQCIDGGDQHPINATCPVKRWKFTKCPACHCNGHSTCVNGTDTCIKCFGHVAGKHCDKCEPRYFGNPENNGTCIRCFCNGHLSSCDSKTGKCKCNLQGATGDHCGKCQIFEPYHTGYFGNASNGGMCYKNLSVNYEYPWNMSNCVKAGFRLDILQKHDEQVELIIERRSGSRSALLNVSIYYKGNGKTTTISTSYPVGKYARRFSEKDYEYYPAEIRAIIFGITEEEWIKLLITVRLPPPLFNFTSYNITSYFIIIAVVCFCALSIILLVWKRKLLSGIYGHNRAVKKEIAEKKEIAASGK